MKDYAVKGVALTDADGSIDLYFALQAPKGKESNWTRLSGQELVAHPAHIWAAGALDRQDLAAGEY